MKNIIATMPALAIIVMSLLPVNAWADNPTNVCKPDYNNPDTTDTVLCTWPFDPSATPQPDIADCQGKLRVPTSSADDCGNSDFLNCMQGKGFQCSENHS